MKWQIPYEGKTWEFDDERLTASEARIQKRLTDGMTPVRAEAARMEGDPDVLIAALVIARVRAGVDREEALVVNDELVDLVAITDATNAALDAEISKLDAAAKAAAADDGPDADTAPAEASPAA
jgi:hypothetical protein